MSESPRTGPRPAGVKQLAVDQAQAQSQSTLGQSQAGRRVAHGRGVEQAGENAPYAVPLGSRDVTLADKYLKDEGCARLAHELLGRGDSLEVQTLDLRANDIRRYGAEALAGLLRETASIERLNELSAVCQLRGNHEAADSSLSLIATLAYSLIS